jgi:hypothetical protein
MKGEPTAAFNGANLNIAIVAAGTSYRRIRLSSCPDPALFDGATAALPAGAAAPTHPDLISHAGDVVADDVTAYAEMVGNGGIVKKGAPRPCARHCSATSPAQATQ